MDCNCCCHGVHCLVHKCFLQLLLLLLLLMTTMIMMVMTMQASVNGAANPQVSSHEGQMETDIKPPPCPPASAVATGTA